ncbi:CidA/LrgA family protein [Myroides sp. WP-1]|uniref:CidA/LrgA family protein n=1 Tax=Myroides sp. WP-1 TaxID=2759944 RepID=UPI0015FDE300|nr:CidA/LrgA family protein [Myroides sp. WP-1]MBB1139912.1 CidA/LrgA family protein [Myroides sp. WP-1]
MNVVKQVAVIFGCLAFGELIIYLTDIKLPSSIIGLITLWTLLQTQTVKVDAIQDISGFLMRNMGIFFVPPCVAMLNYFDLLQASFVPLIVATLLSTVLVVCITGFTHQLLRKRKK